MNFKSIILLSLLTAASASAQKVQTQQGIVHRITRSAQDSLIPVPAVRVTISDATAISDHVGCFTAVVRTADRDKTYFLTEVKAPNGFLWASPQKGKKLFLSRNDLEISVITPEEKNTEYKRRYNILKEKYELQSQKLREMRISLDQKLQQLSESDANYARIKTERDSVQRLYLDYINNEEKFDKEIARIAEELALTDYRSLDSLEVKIYELKKEGEWESLSVLLNKAINGNLKEFLSEGNRLKEYTEQEKQKAIALDNAAAVERARRFRLGEEAIEAFKMQYKNDSAAYYYEILTQEDSTNWVYLMQAGNFESKYMARYDKAMNYCQRALLYECRYTCSNKL